MKIGMLVCMFNIIGIACAISFFPSYPFELVASLNFYLPLLKAEITPLQTNLNTVQIQNAM